ncbi:MAG: UDP-N-acetylmuramate dehydrogenase [Clostridia bacterium]|nr:UDP-N-acetylmuramate dehydrogenase [Clostridia bacterium]
MSENITLKEEFNNICECFENYPLAKHSTFKIGGPAEYCAFPKTVGELCALLTIAKMNGVRARVFGGASNLLLSSQGVAGLVILTTKMKGISLENGCVRALAGTRLSELCNFAARESLCGAEFLFGIPGTVGGAVYMNAGAHGGEVSHILVESICYDTEKDEILTLTAEEHELAYRQSVFSKRPLIVLSSLFKLCKGEHAEIEAKMKALTEKRRQSQPLDMPSAGSVFKRPSAGFAGKYIEDAGLKGLRIGGAEVSRKHAGFIVNAGGATSQDVLELIEKTKEEVFRLFGVMLETEIMYIE